MLIQLSDASLMFRASGLVVELVVIGGGLQYHRVSLSILVHNINGRLITLHLLIIDII